MPVHAPSEPELRKHLASLNRRLAELISDQQAAPAGESRGLQGLIDEVRVSIAWVEYLLGEPGKERVAHRHLLPRL